MTEKLVVAVNGSTGSASALGWAIHRSTTVDVSLELVSVVELEPVRGWPDVDEILPAYERMLLAAVARVAAEAPGVPVTTRVRRGNIRRELLEASAGCDMLVMGTRDPTGYFSGTLRHHIVAEANCLVAIIPSGWSSRIGPIVVGLDSDDTSTTALDFAAAEALRLSRVLMVVHAWHMPVSEVLEWLSVGADPSKHIEANHDSVLASAVARLRADFPDLTIEPALRHGNAAVVLTEAAGPASAVVIGTHGRGLMASAVLGSVGHDLLLTMPSPVLVMPSDPVAPQ